MRRQSRFVVFVFLLLLLAGYAWAAPSQQSNSFQIFLSDMRFDLELLADAQFGIGVRSESWTFNDQPNSKTFIADLWYDNEQLADAIFGPGVRPPAGWPNGTAPDSWIGATSSNAIIVARNIRHDLELSAEAFYSGAVSEDRPAGWRGADRIYSCSRSLQNLVTLMDVFYIIQPGTSTSVFDYCDTLAAEMDDQLSNIILRETGLQSQLPDLILAVRGDLERLADQVKGLDSRPADWIRNVDRESPSLISDNFLDLESLANDQLGTGRRPEGWIGLVTNSAVISFRNLRHDLELLADALLGEGVRPHGWQGVDPLMACDSTVQNLEFVVAQNYNYVIDDAIKTSPDFCSLVEFEINDLAENPPLEELAQAQEERYMAESEWAFTYLDTAALQYMGKMPAGARFRAWYRNFGGSTMMFVSGDDFAVYLDQRWTTMSKDIFETLPLLEGVKPLTFCDASWCNGPAPTPTPTGYGALEALVYGTTPQPTISAGEISGKTQVSWNHVRVNYLLDKAETKTAQVTLEICAEPAQISCEPVIRVFDNNTGTEKPVLSQFNGLNVYEFPYGYTANLIIEGATRISPDVWISDPTIR
jgi:hypothetical protein